MCGIYCQFNDSINIDVVKKGINHRGPDSFNFIKIGNLDLVHSRLSILDLSSLGNQPMQTDDQRYSLIYNGEIYNHLELRSSLLNDYEFKSSSDTETLLAGLIKFGNSFISNLNGIFAFVFFDSLEENILVSRDPLGVKPLYLYQRDNQFYISSELKAFIDKLSSPGLNYNAISNYLTYLWSINNQTPISDVRRIAPGEQLNIKLNKSSYSISSKIQGTINFSQSKSNTEHEYIERLDILLQNSVKRQLLSDVPVGFFLSGGLDSSLLLAIAKKVRPDYKFECFTIDTDDINNEGFISDLTYAKQVASLLNCNLNIVKADIKILDDFDKMVWHLDEPQADPSPLLVNAISKEARNKNIKVLIGGTGGDDVFSGYRRHQSLYFEKYLSLLPNWISSFVYSFFNFLPFPHSVKRRVTKFYNNNLLSSDEKLVDKFRWIHPDEVENLFLKSKQSLIYKDIDSLNQLLLNIGKEHETLNRLLYLEQNSFLINHNLNYTDKLSMAEGVEVRVPYLDLELVKFANSLPVSLKMKGIKTKYILRKVAERYLPKEIIYRPKTGFGGPVRKWIKNDLEPLIEKRLSRDVLLKRGIFDPNAVAGLIRRNKIGEIDASYTIWALLALESWMLQFIDRENLVPKQ
jgi:asparagine synthase (glutamine-hydrolysing)